MGSFSIWHWLIVLLLVLLLFGTGKLRNIGGDLGRAIRGFKDEVAAGDKRSISEVYSASDYNADNKRNDEK